MAHRKRIMGGFRWPTSGTLAARIAKAASHGRLHPGVFRVLFGERSGRENGVEAVPITVTRDAEQCALSLVHPTDEGPVPVDVAAQSAAERVVELISHFIDLFRTEASKFDQMCFDIVQTPDGQRLALLLDIFPKGDNEGGGVKQLTEAILFPTGGGDGTRNITTFFQFLRQGYATTVGVLLDTKEGTNGAEVVRAVIHFEQARV